jgi:hypothetical protein
MVMVVGFVCHPSGGQETGDLLEKRLSLIPALPHQRLLSFRVLGPWSQW